jgi:hypothetical protein
MHTSSGVMAVDEDLLIRKHAISEFETKRIYQVQHSAFDFLREFYHSATPFCCGIPYW